MAKQTIDTGSGELAGDGETLRSAWTKANANFAELYGQVSYSDSDVAAYLPTYTGNLTASIAASNVTGLSSVATTGAYTDLSSKPTTLAGYGITDGRRPEGVVIVPPDTGFSTDSANPTILDNTTNSTYVITGNGATVDIYADLGSGAYVGQVITFGDSWLSGAGSRVKISGNIFDPSTLTASQRTLTGLGQTYNFVWDGTAWYY